MLLFCIFVEKGKAGMFLSAFTLAVPIKEEVRMVSVQFTQEKHNALVGFLMIVLAVLFLLYMGSSLVHSTRIFWENYSIENLLE